YRGYSMAQDSKTVHCRALELRISLYGVRSMKTASQDHVAQDLDSREIQTDPGPAGPPIGPTAEGAQDEGREALVLSDAPILVPLNKLYPHPQNPRIDPGEDIIERIRASLVLSGRFDPAYAPIARPLGDGYQNLSGHRRATAARRAGLTE